LPDATRLHHFRWRKKKVDGFVIPAKYFYGRVKELEVEAPEILDVPSKITIESPQKNETVTVETQSVTTIDVSDDAVQITTTTTETVTEKTTIPVSNEPKVSALSLASIRAKRELQETSKATVKETTQLPTEPFSETDMLLHWNKYAQKLGDKGYKIMESLLLINDPVLNGTKITIELPNEGSKIDFESEKNALLGYLKGHLHNHDISIDVVVNESVENKFAFSPQDKFNRLNEINPTLDVLRKTFDLDL
jgi:DNA polymerase-3 subunit gamma/tau